MDIKEKAVSEFEILLTAEPARLFGKDRKMFSTNGPGLSLQGGP
jgi:hypothetical protein